MTMKRYERLLLRAASLGLGVAIAASPRLLGQTNLRVVPGEVVDDRFSEGMLTGHLHVELGIEGEGRDGIKAARFLVKESKDDTGSSLVGKDRKEARFEKVDQQMRVRVDLGTPPRKAKTFQLSGKLELFVPAKDPKSVVKVPGALRTKDKPLKSSGLKSAKVGVTVLSKSAYDEQKKKQKLDDAKIAEIRAEGKKHGMSDKETDALIELGKALQEMGDTSLTDAAVILTGKLADMEKIVDVGLQKSDGTSIDIGESSSSSDGKTKTMVLKPRETPPADAVLVFTLLTEKAKISIPVDLTDVPLP